MPSQAIYNAAYKNGTTTLAQKGVTILQYTDGDALVTATLNKSTLYVSGDSIIITYTVKADKGSLDSYSLVVDPISASVIASGTYTYTGDTSTTHASIPTDGTTSITVTVPALSMGSTFDLTITGTVA